MTIGIIGAGNIGQALARQPVCPHPWEGRIVIDAILLCSSWSSFEFFDCFANVTWFSAQSRMGPVFLVSRLPPTFEGLLG